MTLSREEIAVRFAVEYAVRNRFAPENAVRQGFQAADAFAEECARRSFATPAPVAPPAGKYVPAVGDIVIGLFHDDALARVDSTEPLRWSSWGNGRWHSDCEFGLTHDARLATDAEKRAAGLAVPPPAPAPAPEVCCASPLCPHPPAPEAKRPTHVRITGPKDHRSVTIGKVYEVLYFDDDRARLIIKNDDGFEWGLSNKPDDGPAFPTWAPAPCPPPVAGSARRVLTEEQFAFYEACRVLFLTNDDSPAYERIRDEFYDPVWVTVDAMKAAERGEVRP